MSFFSEEDTASQLPVTLVDLLIVSSHCIIWKRTQRLRTVSLTVHKPVGGEALANHRDLQVCVPTGFSTNKEAPPLPCLSIWKPDSMVFNPPTKGGIPALPTCGYTVNNLKMYGGLIETVGGATWRGMYAFYRLHLQDMSDLSHRWAFGLGLCCVFSVRTQHSAV